MAVNNIWNQSYLNDHYDRGLIFKAIRHPNRMQNFNYQPPAASLSILSKIWNVAKAIFSKLSLTLFAIFPCGRKKINNAFTLVANLKNAPRVIPQPQEPSRAADIRKLWKYEPDPQAIELWEQINKESARLDSEEVVPWNAQKILLWDLLDGKGCLILGTQNVAENVNQKGFIIDGTRCSAENVIYNPINQKFETVVEKFIDSDVEGNSESEEDDFIEEKSRKINLKKSHCLTAASWQFLSSHLDLGHHEQLRIGLKTGRIKNFALHTIPFKLES